MPRFSTLSASLLGVLCLAAGCTAPHSGGTPDGGTCASPKTQGMGTAISIVNDPGGATLGYGDPSLLYPAGAATGYMTYTPVGVGVASTRIARSSDHGATWTYVGDVNQATPLAITTSDQTVCGATACSGLWVHETSTLVDDPTDPDPARRYKVFAHSYFIDAANHNNHYAIGSIDMWTTAAVTPAASWQETRLLGWQSSSPRSSTGVSTVVTTDPALSPLFGHCLFLDEPGALVHGGEIDLVVGCVGLDATSTPIVDILMIRSTDHGLSWTPVGKVLDPGALGSPGSPGHRVSAGDLFDAGGKTWLLATGNGSVSFFGTTRNGYDGCRLFAFSDLATGTLGGCGGALVPTLAFADAQGRESGSCTYAPGASAAGFMDLVAAGTLSASPHFEIHATGVTLP